MDELILSPKDLLLLEDLPGAQSSYAASNWNIFVRLTLNLLKISDGASTQITFLNREVSTSLETWPLLVSVSGVGITLDEYLPRSTRASVTLNNAPNSFNINRRISDLLEDYTIVNQEASLSIAKLKLGDETLETGDFSEIFRAIVTGIEVSGDNLRITLNNNLIESRVTTRVIDSDSFPNAPIRSLGRHLPVIFSSEGEYIEIEPIQVDEMTETGGYNQITYAYATTYGTQFLPGENTDDVKVLIEDQNREFQEITFVSDPDTPILNFPLVSPGGSTTGSYADIWEELSEIGYKLTAGEGGISAGHLVVGCDWTLAGQETDATASVTAKVYSESNGFPLNVLSSDTILLSETAKFTESTISGGGPAITTFHFAFPRAVVVPAGGSIFVTLSRPKDPNSDFLPLVFDGNPAPLSSFEEYTLLDLDGYRTDFRRQVRTDRRWHLQVYACAYDDTPNAGASNLIEGLGYSTFAIKYRDQNNVPNLSASRFLAKAQGLRDDASGTLTGTGYFRLLHPLYQAQLLNLSWNGSSWAVDKFDSTKFSNTHTAAYPAGSRWEIRTSGATQGRTTVAGLLSDVCRAGGSRIAAYGSTGTKYLGIYAHGTATTPSTTITDEDCKLLSFRIGGIDTVVNQVLAIYSRTIQTRTESLLAEGGLNNYSALMNSSEETLDITSSYVTRSIARWGANDLSDSTFPWINTSDTMLSVLGLMLRRFNEPAWEVEIELPLWHLSSLNILDTVNLYLTGLPKYEGTAYSTAADTSTGDFLHTAQTYEFQIEGISYDFSDRTAPVRRLSLRKIQEADV